MNIGHVYKITNPEGKVYIGSTKKSCAARWKLYQNLSCKTQVKLHNSILKYGYENHVFESIWTGDVTKLFEKEVYYGSLYNVLDRDKGLNLRLPKAGELPTYTSEETKLKMSKALKGRVFTAEHLENMSKSRLGKPMSQETKDKISKYRKGRKMSEEQKQRISKTMLERNGSDRF